MNMRKTTQSMYQSKLPTSKIIDGSNLFNNRSNLNGNQSNYGSSSKIQPSSIKKVEGQDIGRSGIKTSKTNFEQTVTNLKNKPTQKVLEDQYINGLQQEIKYLEYQLKLLKDKELIERQGVNQLDNFLKDEIPVNENILAIKNKYNSTKQNLQRQYKELISEITEAEGVLSMQKGEIQKLHACIDAHRKQTAQRKAEFQSKISDLMKQLSLTKDEYEAISQQNKIKQEAIKKYNEQLAALQRKLQKEKVQQVRANQQKEKKKQKFSQNFSLNKDQLIESQQKIEELEAYGETNPLLEPLQQENTTLRKKIMLNDKQKSTADNIIAEIQLFLKQEARQREVQRQQKMKLVNQGERYRLELQHLERYVDQLIKEQTLRTKNKMIKEMNVSLIEKEQNYQLLTDRLRNLEQQCGNLIQEKKELNDAIDNQKNIGKEFDEKLAEIKNNILTGRSRNQSFIRLTAEITNDIGPTQGELQKCKGRIPIVQRDIEKKKIMIHHLNKQVDLLKQLKTLDMQQLQMISNGGSNVQNTLHSFIKNWEKIKNM